MASVLAAGFGPILLACKNQLVAQIPFLTADPSHCIVAGKKEVPQFKEDHDVVLKPGSFISMKQETEGGGRFYMAFKRYLLMYPRCRVALDEADSDEVFLTDSTLGFLPWEELCVSALAGFFPVDTSLNQLTNCEIHVADGTDPFRAPMGEWGDSVVTFEVDYPFKLGGTFWNPPIITSAVPSAGTKNVVYSFSVTASSPINGTTPYTWTTLGTLPDGLSINSTTGIISGTPTKKGTFLFTVVCTDTAAQRAASAYTVVIS